jgi:hypothetical protein
MRSTDIAATEEMSGKFMPTFFPVLAAPSPLPNPLASGAHFRLLFGGIVATAAGRWKVAGMAGRTDDQVAVDGSTGLGTAGWSASKSAGWRGLAMPDVPGGLYISSTQATCARTETDYVSGNARAASYGPETQNRPLSQAGDHDPRRLSDGPANSSHEMNRSARHFVRARERLIRRARGQGSLEYTLIILGVCLVYCFVMAVWVAIQQDPN